MSNRKTSTAADSFRSVYAFCRLNRGNVHFDGQFFGFTGGGNIYISGRDLVIGKAKRFNWDSPGWRVAELNLYRSNKQLRREAVEASRSVGRVPLP